MLFKAQLMSTLTSPLAFLTALMLASHTVYGATKAAENSESGVQVSHAIALHDEPKYPANFTHFDYASPKAIKGGEVRLHALGSFDSLNPYIAKGTPDSKVFLIYDTLTVGSSDEPSTQYGLVAEKIEYPKDKSWVIYHINPKARFHDGKQITANDIVFSFNTLITKGMPIFSSYYADIKDVVAIDSLRVKFTFKNTTNKQLVQIVGSIPVLPEHFWKNKPFDKSNLDIPLGSGPYKVHSVDAGKSITYERVKNYWAKDLPVNLGSYNFEKIIVDYYRDDNVVVEALKAKQIDFRYERSAKIWNTAYEIPAAKAGLLKKQIIRDYSPQNMQSFTMNLRKPPFDNIKFREALNYAFDFEWSNKNLFFGSYTRIDSFFFNADLASTGIPEGRELEILMPFKNQLPESVFTKAYKNPVTDGAGNNRNNLNAAKKLLSEAGYSVVEGKLIDPINHRPVVIEFLLHDPIFERVLNPYVENLKRLGIQLNIKQVDISQFVNRVNKYDFEMIVASTLAITSPGSEQRDFWTSSAADIEGSFNYGGIKNPVVDALVELLINAPTREELVVRTRALDRVLLHNHYVIPQWASLNHRVVYWDKFKQPDVPPKMDPTFITTLMTWWIDPEKLK